MAHISELDTVVVPAVSISELDTVVGPAVNISELDTLVGPAVNISELDTLVGPAVSIGEKRARYIVFWQIVRFGIVGILNTGIDVLTFNILIFLNPTNNANLLLLFNSITFVLGAINSFLLNKYWTFRRKRAIRGSELLRFAVVNAVGILCNDALIWSIARILHPLITNTLLWANAAKLCAVLGTALITYFGMRLWVFAGRHYPQ